MRLLYISFHSYPLYILIYLHHWYIIYYLCFLYNLPNLTINTSTIRLTINIKNIIRIKTKDIKDYTAKNHNIENIIKVTIKTRPEKNTIFIIRKDISL
jgi:hypothetical protein